MNPRHGASPVDRFFFRGGGLGSDAGCPDAQAQGIPGNTDFMLLLLLLCPPAKAQVSHGSSASHGVVSGDLGLADSLGSWVAAHAPGSCSGAGGGGLPGSRSGSFLAEFDLQSNSLHKTSP